MILTETACIETKEKISEDKFLIEAAKANMADFSLLYNKYYAPVFRFVYRRVEDEEIAQDVVSQTFLSAMSNLATYQERGAPFLSWLLTIARNEINMFFRKLNKERIFYLNVANENQLIEDLGEKNEIDIDKSLKLLMETLSEEELELIEMKYFEKRSYSEIAEIVKLTESNAKVKVHRIVQKLKQKSMQLRALEIGVLFFMLNSLILVL